MIMVKPVTAVDYCFNANKQAVPQGASALLVE